MCEMSKLMKFPTVKAPYNPPLCKKVYFSQTNWFDVLNPESS